MQVSTDVSKHKFPFIKVPGLNDRNKEFCVVCISRFSTDYAGKNDIQKHSKMKKHKELESQGIKQNNSFFNTRF